MICPLNYHEFKSLMKSNKVYTEEDIRLLFEANEKLTKEEHLGGNHSQHGGVECLTLHNIYKYSLSILLFTGGVYCGIYKRSEVAETIVKFVEMVKTAFNEEHFKHIWDVVGKTSLGFSFMERFTKYILEVFKKPEHGVTMTWLKNLFELLCKVEDGVKVENIDQKLKDIIIQASDEMLEQQQQQPIQQIPTKNENIVYDGKILTIQMGDAMITISPNIFKSRRSRSSSSFLTPKAGLKQTKTKKKKMGKKRRL